MGTYSLGMRQRTKLAQAFAHDPSLLILDEPFNGLDPIGRHEMTEVLREWVRGGRSLILASHILHEVEAVSPSFLLDPRRATAGLRPAGGNPQPVGRRPQRDPRSLRQAHSAGPPVRRVGLDRVGAIRRGGAGDTRFHAQPGGGVSSSCLTGWNSWACTCRKCGPLTIPCNDSSRP